MFGGAGARGAGGCARPRAALRIISGFVCFDLLILEERSYRLLWTTLCGLGGWSETMGWGV